MPKLDYHNKICNYFYFTIVL